MQSLESFTARRGGRLLETSDASDRRDLVSDSWLASGGIQPPEASERRERATAG
jgi:hypothetical protein